MLFRRLDIIPDWLSDVDAYDQTYDETMETVLWTILVNFIILVLFVLIFSIYRMYDGNVYAPKVTMMPSKCPPKLSNQDMYQWVTELWCIDDETILANGGFDILSFIRFYRLNFQVFFMFAIYAWFVLIPINSVGGNDYAKSNLFDAFSMTNISQGSNKCWFHLFGTVLLSLITVYYLEKEFVFYAKHRHKYLAQRRTHLRTVLVEGIPFKMRSNVTLSAYFNALYPNSVLRVRVGQDLSELEKVIADRMTAIRNLERCLYKEKLEQERPQITVDNNTIDSIKYYSEEVVRLNNVIAEKQVSANIVGANIRHERDNEEEAIRTIARILGISNLDVIRRFINENDGEQRLDEEREIDTSIERRTNTNNNNNPQNQNYGSISTTSDNNTAMDSEMNNDDDVDAMIADFENSDNILTVFSELTDESTTKLTWSLWFDNLINAPTFQDFWRILKEGRDYDSTEGMESEERESLIRPKEERNQYLPKAFVTFKTFTAATIARQVIHMQLPGHMTVSEAPEPRDVLWHNLYYTRKGTILRRLLVDIIVVLLVVFWIIPVTAISYFVSEAAIRTEIPIVDKWCDNSELFTSIIELIQPGALLLLMQVLPPLFNILGDFEGCISFSQNQFKGFDRYFFFQVVNVYLVTTIAGSVIDSIEDITTDPSEVFELLGSSLPKMGAYFTAYIIMKAFIGLGMELIRLIAFFMALGKYVFTSNLTVRERKEFACGGALRFMSNPGWLPFAKIYAQDALVVVLCATFACISPVLLFAGLAYFAGASYVYTHQLMYVYEPVYETGGRWWPKIATSIVVALLFAQCTMVGMMILKETYDEIYVLFILVVFTILYLVHTRNHYEPLAKQLPFDLATTMDIVQKNRNEKLYDDEDFVQPPLRSDIKTLHPMTEFETIDGLLSEELDGSSHAI